MICRYKKIKLAVGSNRDEHRLIMENYLGRKLDRYEISHHCNENPRDNRIENLELMLLSVHSRLHMKGHIPSNKGKTKTLHGTVSRYDFGCRCKLCTKAMCDYKKVWRLKKSSPDLILLSPAS